MYKSVVTIYVGSDPRATVTVMQDGDRWWITDYWGRNIPTTQDTYLMDAHDVSRQYAEHFHA